ncbi:MAG: hypothetical protein HY824_07005 [Acidobacteria bacterium]|nr:hypothetical protein [Acidobacteriota bacterium]
MPWTVLSAQINMPDPSIIHGKALPAPELPAGTVTVRVVREAIGNNVTEQEVRLTIGGAPRTAKTDAQGRAEFSKLPAGGEGRAETTVSGEQLVSDPFTVPPTGGLRVILVAGLKEAAARAAKEAAAAAAAPPVRGTVVFGPNSRVLMEFRDDALQVFYVLEILNTARARVDIGGPLILDLPTGAGGAGILEGSSPAATVSGDRVTVTGPFAAGATTVEVGFQLRYDQPDMTLTQKWPAAVQQLNVAVEKIGDVSVTSPQLATVGEVRAENGTPFLLGNGPALAPGATLTVQLANLPVHSPVPRYVALGMAALIMGLGAWFACARRASAGEIRRQLAQRRDTLLAELAAVEKRQARKGGAPSASDEARRQRLVTELEQIYGQLDEVGGGPEGGGKDVAA